MKDDNQVPSVDELVEYCQTQAGLLSGYVETISVETDDLLDEINEDIAEIRTHLAERANSTEGPTPSPTTTGPNDSQRNITELEQLETELKEKQTIAEAKRARIAAFQDLARAYIDVAEDTEDIRERVKALTDGRGADVVYDPVGGDVFKASLRCIAWSGRIVVIGFASGEVPAPPANILLVKNIAVLGFYWGSYRTHAPDLMRRQFDDLRAWLQAGKLHPYVSARYPLADARGALEALKSRRTSGKIVLTV